MMSSCEVHDYNPMVGVNNQHNFNEIQLKFGHCLASSRHRKPNMMLGGQYLSILPHHQNIVIVRWIYGLVPTHPCSVCDSMQFLYCDHVQFNFSLTHVFWCLCDVVYKQSRYSINNVIMKYLSKIIKEF